MTFFGDLPKIKKKYGTLNFLLIQDHIGLEILKRYSPTVLIQSESNFMINKAAIRAYKVRNVLAMCQKLKILWHFEILTWESMGKS